jgi:hypothetical protein
MLKRNFEEIEEKKNEFNMNSVDKVSNRLKRKKQRLLAIKHEMMGLNMQIKCLEGQLKKICKHNWVKIREDTGMYNKPPLKCMNCGLIQAVAQP